LKKLILALWIGIVLSLFSATMDALRWVLQEWYVPSFTVTFLCSALAMLMYALIYFVELKHEASFYGQAKS
jgi:hypothetical protein